MTERRQGHDEPLAHDSNNMDGDEKVPAKAFGFGMLIMGIGLCMTALNSEGAYTQALGVASGLTGMVLLGKTYLRKSTPGQSDLEG